MPRITNNTNQDIWFPQLGTTIPANNYVDSDVYPVTTSTSAQTTSATVIPAGLTIDTTHDAMDPILDFQLVSSSKTYSLPTTIVPRTSYKIKIYCTAGTVAVQFNYSGNTSFQIPINDYFEIAVQSRTIDNIIFTISNSGVAYVTVRKA